MALRSVIRIESSGSRLGMPSGKRSGVRTWLKPVMTRSSATLRRFSLHMGALYRAGPDPLDLPRQPRRIGEPGHIVLAGLERLDLLLLQLLDSGHHVAGAA